MLKGHNMIYFGDKWDRLLRNRQQLMSVFSKHNKVLFVEQEPYLRPTLVELRRGELRLSDLCHAPLRQISENLFVFSGPLWAPVSGRFPLNHLTRLARRRALAHTLQELKMSQPIVWFYHPKWLEMVGQFSSASLRLYHVVDEYASFRDKTPARRRLVEEREKRILARVDAVIVVSKALYEAKSPFNPNTYLVPNGVDYQAYAKALADPRLPDALQAIQPPRLGYSGLIGDKLDLRMLEDLAQGNPEWSLVFVGAVNVSRQAETWRALQAMPNVHYLGSVEWSQVPQYVKGFDVGLMPYLQYRHTETISPLKLYDYLAAGLPIVSSDIPAAREFNSYVHIANGSQDFSRALQAALMDIAPERIEARRRVAAQHTWEARAEQLSDLIHARLMAKEQSDKSARGRYHAA